VAFTPVLSLSLNDFTVGCIVSPAPNVNVSPWITTGLRSGVDIFSGIMGGFFYWWFYPLGSIF